jgi:hypothetical protein
MPKPNKVQRAWLQGYERGSVMAEATAEERKRLKAAMKRDRDDRAAYERTMKYGSSPRSG